MRALNQRESKAAALGLLALVVSAVDLFLAAPYLGAFSAYEKRIDDASERLQRYQGIAASRDRVEEQMQRMIADQRVARLYLNADSVSLATAELQQLVKQAIVQSQGTLISTQPVATRAGETLVPASIKVRMQGDSAVLHKLLHALQRRRPVNRQARDLENLDIRFDLTGYIRPGGA